MTRVIPKLIRKPPAPVEGSLADFGIGPNKDVKQMRDALAVAAPGSASSEAVVPRLNSDKLESSSGYVVGQTYAVPIQNIDENRYNARVFYTTVELDEMSVSLRLNGQDVAALGYVNDAGRVVLTDGQKRLRSARLGGNPTLNVCIEPPPESPLENYKKSRRVNIERSTHTALDDAIQWQHFIDEGFYKSKADLARDLKVSEGWVSQVLGMCRLPLRVQNAMKERPKTCEGGIGYELSHLFAGDPDADFEDRVRIALDLVGEIGDKALSTKQVRALVQAKLGPKKTRAHALPHAFTYGGANGSLKVFPSKGKLELSIAGLDANKLEVLKGKIEQLLEQPDTVDR